MWRTDGRAGGDTQRPEEAVAHFGLEVGTLKRAGYRGWHGSGGLESSLRQRHTAALAVHGPSWERA